MSFLDSFNNFYDNLSTSGLIFFWIVIFLLVFLLFLSFALIIKNKKLIKTMIENRKIIEEKEAKINDMIASFDAKASQENLQIVETPKEESLKEEKTTNIVKEAHNGPYQKNILREMNTRMQTSPIHIEKDENSSFDGFDVSGIDMREDSISPLEEMEDIYEPHSDTVSFAEDLSRKMEEEKKSSNIELTDYEKKEEEEAIISYEELQKVKDKIYNITEDEETDEFIDELKSFRLDLQ